MKELVEFIAGSIVSQPDRVQVSVEETGSSADLQLSVGPEDVGMIIGRRGQMVNSIRSLLRVMGARSGVGVNLKIE